MYYKAYVKYYQTAYYIHDVANKGPMGPQKRDNSKNYDFHGNVLVVSFSSPGMPKAPKHSPGLILTHFGPIWLDLTSTTQYVQKTCGTSRPAVISAIFETYFYNQ